ncbi:MAG: hypothetical protein H7176_01115 [Bdellovibrionales bacterium]|nr:hypothetical protein [Massilia sp.]
MPDPATGNLGPFYRFFETYGSVRLDGLNDSHFADLTTAEKEEAWNYLKDRFECSDERISGMYTLDPSRAVVLFKETLKKPMEASPYAASREAIEESRLMLLNFVNSVEPDKQYVDAMTEFARSEFENVRFLFARTAPIYPVTPEIVAALKGLIFTETERLPLSAAISKYMVINGMDFDLWDPLYNSIYMSLRSDDPKTKMAAMKRLEEHQAPDYR